MNYNDYFSPKGWDIAYVKVGIQASSRKGWREYANPDAVILSADEVGGVMGELPFDKSKERGVYGYVHFGSYEDQDESSDVVNPVSGVLYRGFHINWIFSYFEPADKRYANMVRVWIREGVKATVEVIHYQRQKMVEGAVLLIPQR